MRPETGDPVDLLVVGGGISGLATAWEARRRRPEWRILVLEREAAPGGTMRSERVGGCVCEWGPNGFLTNVPHTRDLAVDSGLGDRLLSADSTAAQRFLWVRGALRPLAMKPTAFLRSDLLSVPGRARLLCEPFVPRRHEGEESVHGFAARRIGKEAASVLVDALVSGVYAGDPTTMSLAAAFPRVAEMEAEHGSLFRAMLARRRSRSGGSPAGPGGVLTSFDLGMEVLIRRLAQDLGPALVTGAPVQELARAGPGFEVRADQGGERRSIRARRVVLAVPSHAAHALLKSALPDVACVLGDISYAGITVACLVYERRQIGHPLRGFGFLVPRSQGLRILGCIWTGSIFPRHVPSGRVLLRAMIGGGRDPEGAMLSEGRTVDLVHAELERVLGGIEGRPAEVAVFRHAKGIPQYTLGHTARIALLEERLARVPDLHVAGNAYRGIGVNDCVREARELAARLTASASAEHAAWTAREARA